MKIPLDVRTSAGGLKPFANVYLKIPSQIVRGSTVRGVFSAFVDTGSPYTLISEIDSLKLRIQLRGKPMQVPIGGSLLHKYDINGVELKVLCDEKKTFCDIGIPTIGVMRPMLEVPRSSETSKAMPSIIGVDVLKHHRLALYFDVCNEISYLEKV
jgi:hypothetical protein